MIINGKTRTVALIGNPVEHSFSPFMHNYGFKTNDLNMIYINHTVKKVSLKEGIQGIKALNYLGANITYPYKTEVIQYLDEISKEARLIGAVNTIKNENGNLIGYNTDGLGFIFGLNQEGVKIKRKTICILGAGGAARSIVISLCLKFNCKVVICNRDIKKAEEISYIVNNSDRDFLGRVVGVIDPNELHLKNVDILINCTPIGMGEFKEIIPFESKLKFNKRMIVCDLIYNPYETKFLNLAKRRGCITYNGLNMLIGQGILAFKIWTNKKINFSEVREEIKNIIQN